MKVLKSTHEYRVYSEDEAKDAINNFRTDAREKGYTVGAAGYTYKAKKKTTLFASQDIKKSLRF